MKKRYFWLGGVGLVIVIVIAGLVYTSHYASVINSTQAHTAPGAATATGTPIPSTGLSTFQIVSAQTTASYSVFEDLIFQNKPNNDAIGTTHSVQGSFKIRTGASPLVPPMTIQVDLRTLQSDSSRRDNVIQQTPPDTAAHPYATSVSARTPALPPRY